MRQSQFAGRRLSRPDHDRAWTICNAVPSRGRVPRQNYRTLGGGVTLEADAVTDGHGSGEPPGHDEARLGSGDVGRAQQDTVMPFHMIAEAAGHANRVLRMF